jgi:hypothetical protein
MNERKFEVINGGNEKTIDDASQNKPYLELVQGGVSKAKNPEDKYLAAKRGKVGDLVDHVFDQGRVTVANYLNSKDMDDNVKHAVQSGLDKIKYVKDESIGIGFLGAKISMNLLGDFRKVFSGKYSQSDVERFFYIFSVGGIIGHKIHREVLAENPICQLVDIETRDFYADFNEELEDNRISYKIPFNDKTSALYRRQILPIKVASTVASELLMSTSSVDPRDVYRFYDHLRDTYVTSPINEMSSGLMSQSEANYREILTALAVTSPLQNSQEEYFDYVTAVPYEN